MTLPQVDVHGNPKPMLRGRIHLAALVASLPAGLVLLLQARPGRSFGAAAVYAACLTALYAASSAYHLLGRPGRSQWWLRRLDHSTIYFLIAGTYTPVCVLVLRGWPAWALLAAVWAAAVMGVVLKMVSFERTGPFGGALYVVMGWAIVAVLPALLTRVSAVVFALLVTGGLLYSVGVVVLSRRWPNPYPRVYGYHELWHTFVVVAAACHYAAIYEIVG